MASNNLHKWNRVEQEEEGVDALGMWPKEEMMTDWAYYFLAANKITREWKRGERCEDLWWRSSNHPGPGALWGAAGALILQGTWSCLPTMHQIKQIRSLTPTEDRLQSLSFRHMGKHGKEWGYGSLLIKSEDSLQNFCNAPGKCSHQPQSTMLGKL